MNKYKFETIVTHAKISGFVYPGSEIYGGLANSWDYGPLGVELINNVKKAWWKKFVQESSFNVGIDSAILMNPEVWVASGHLANFGDPLIDCKSCKARHRADKLIEDFDSSLNPGGWSNEQLIEFINQNKIVCPKCGKANFTEIRKFQLMFKTFQGVLEDSTSVVYLRPETAQGIFVNFKNIQRSSRKKIPFGIAQIGKAFRNEITPGNFIFRTREFEQMELEFFCKPGEDMVWYEYWKNYCFNFVKNLGIEESRLRIRDHDQSELSFYSKGTCDIEYDFPFGWGELWGIANRTDYDLKQHQIHSKQSLEYFDQETNEKYLPYCVEPSLGVGRLALVILMNGYHEEELKDGDMRIVLKLHPFIAPFKACIMPQSKQLSEGARSIYQNLAKHFMVEYDETASIGKRYRRQDAIGTPLCITYDFESVNDNMVTIRHRDTMLQERVKIEDIKAYIEKVIEF